jgi:trigger factor
MNFTSSIEEVSTTRRKFKISVPHTDISEAFKTAIQEIQSTAEVRGFRKGKVPTTIVRKFFENDVRKRAVEKVIDQTYGLAIRDANLQIVSQPHIEPVTEFAENQEFKFDATVDVNPPVDIAGYKELTLKAPQQQISETDVDSTLQNLGRAMAKFKPVTDNRPVAETDFVMIDLDVKVDGTTDSDLSKNGVRLELGRQETLPEFKTNLVGLKAGQNKTFSVTYPESYPEKRLAGKTAELTAAIRSIEESEMPAFDDAFAKRFGADSIASLRSSLLESLTRSEEAKKIELFGEQIVEQLLGKNKFEVPESLVESTIDRQIAEANSRMEKKNHMDSKDAKVREGFRDSAVQNVKAILALGNVARMESVAVTDDEIGPELFSIAQSMGMGVKDLVQQGGRMIIDEARGRVLINKTIKHLVGLNKIELA